MDRIASLAAFRALQRNLLASTRSIGESDLLAAHGITHYAGLTLNLYHNTLVGEDVYAYQFADYPAYKARLQASTGHERVALERHTHRTTAAAVALFETLAPAYAAIERDGARYYSMTCYARPDRDPTFSFHFANAAWIDGGTRKAAQSAFTRRLSLFAPYLQEARNDAWTVQGCKVLATTPEGAIAASCLLLYDNTLPDVNKGLLEVKRNYDLLAINQRYQQALHAHAQQG